MRSKKRNDDVFDYERNRRTERNSTESTDYLHPAVTFVLCAIFGSIFTLVIEALFF